MVPNPGGSEPVSDPHDWNSWENYRFVHDKRLVEHPFVLEDHLQWTAIEESDRVRAILLDGVLICNTSVVVSVQKELETRYIRGRLQVRGRFYAYNAHFAGRGNILRYDNGHLETPDQFHRHEFDPETHVQRSVEVLPRREMPTLAGFLDEVARLVRFEERATE